MGALDRPSRTHDAWLALRCQAGEPDAFVDLVAFMGKPLLYYAMKMVGDADAALDVLQDVWMKAFRDIRRLKDPAALRPWLYRITHGVAVDRVRQDTSREKAEETNVVGFQEAYDLSFSEHDAAAVHNVLSQLAPKHREVLVLYFLEDFSLAEIAAVVGCSEGTIKSRLHYGKKEMKKKLSGVGYGTSR